MRQRVRTNAQLGKAFAPIQLIHVPKPGAVATSPLLRRARMPGWYGHVSEISAQSSRLTGS